MKIKEKNIVTENNKQNGKYNPNITINISNAFDASEFGKGLNE